MFDLITVVHNENNISLANNILYPSVVEFASMPYQFFIHDNSIDNIGFGKGCNASAKNGSNPIIGFLNPDAKIVGSFMELVYQTLVDNVVITGANFNKNPVEINNWGLNDWVCGAAMFIKRSWFEEMGGFDERYVWSHEETDFIRETESRGKLCKSLYPEDLLIIHNPYVDTQKDMSYKQHWFADAERKYQQKWM